MKKGFQLEIQKDLTEKENKKAIKFANEWISKTCGNDMTFYRGGRTGGWKSRSFLKRGILGYTRFDNKRALTFRRISTNRRIFAIVKVNTMILKDGSAPTTKGCDCAYHYGGQKVIWKGNKKPNTYVYAIVGDIKG